MFFIYDCEEKMVAKVEADSNLDAAIKVVEAFGDDSGHTIEESESWSDAPDLEDYVKSLNGETAQNETSTELTAEFLTDDGTHHTGSRKWYNLDGCHDGTGITIENQEYCLCENGDILDADGCPITYGDDEHTAVSEAIRQTESHSKKSDKELDIRQKISEIEPDITKILEALNKKELVAALILMDRKNGTLVRSNLNQAGVKKLLEFVSTTLNVESPS